MRTFLTLCILVVGLNGIVLAQQPKEPAIVFEAVEHDFGSITFGGDGTYTFTFTNKTTNPIVLTNVTASCGCTTPMWTKEPVKPGEKGEVKVRYNTNINGTFNKTVLVYSSVLSSPIVLRIRGSVLPRETTTSTQP